ncbi:MAG: hypothetical protein ACHQK9_14150 [Reyranellales bacterium]
MLQFIVTAWRWLLATAAICWWGLVVVARLLWAVRAVLVSVAPGVLLIGGTDQARDIVIASAQPSGHDIRIRLALLVWAVVSWYWARVTLLYTFVNPPLVDPTDNEKGWWEFWTAQIPRLLGMACVASVAKAFYEAAKLYEAAHDAKGAANFNESFWFYVGAAVAFYVAVAGRKWIMRTIVNFLSAEPSPFAESFIPDREQVDQIANLENPLSWIFLGVTLLLAPLAFAAVAADPIGMNVVFGGAVPAVLVGLALIAPITSTLVIVSARLRVPLFGMATLLLVLAPTIWSDNHDIRTCRTLANKADYKGRCIVEMSKRPTLADAFHQWWEANADAAMTVPLRQDDKGKIVAPPMVVVATAGGASRAAFWTSQVLGEIAQRENRFADRVFMISGVSGGSLGAVTFRSIVEADRLNTTDKRGSPQIAKAADKAKRFIENDFLGPALATGLYVDLPARAFAYLLSYAWRPNDRAVALEKAWEDSWATGAISKGQFTWSDGFNNVFNATRPWPILALNGTSVEKGKRIITSNVEFWTGKASDMKNMSGGINRYDTFDMTQSDIPISTSVTMSARFPVISPTGAIRNKDGKIWTRITDGGLFENFGAATADEVLRYLLFRRGDVQSGGYQTMPIAILISSDPSLDQLDLRKDGAINRAPPDCDATKENSRPDPELHDGNGAKECPVDVNRSAELLVDPAMALYNGRVARGEAAATALQDRIADAGIAVRDRLLKAMAKADKVDANSPALFNEFQARASFEDNVDFFHFRQCRVDGKKSPTMSWHDSQEAWDVMQRMLGLTKGANGTFADPCGNQVEFFRLCVRLERLTGTSKDDIKATESCQAKGWPRPSGWVCDEDAHKGTGPNENRPWCHLKEDRKG